MNLRRTAGAVAGMAVVAAVVSASPAGAQDPPPAAGPGQLRTITLLTGDQVRVVDGKVAGVRMAAGRETQPVWQYEVNGHQYVLPADAAPLVEQDRLDRRLFDITELAGQGLDDTATRTVPLIVQGAPAPRAAERTGTVPGRGLTVVEAPKSGAAWHELRATAGARGSTAGATAGKVWLNGRVRPALEDSVPQVGAPEAWSAGHTGAGATVAVLDTGYDASHPDLAGLVDLAQDFTEEGVADSVGHGTHVAATIAGTGAASDGRRKGVAPGARLLVGKVLGEYGGTEAGLIAGMQWAVDHGADVVNMSLGGSPTDGTDLMSQTLNELSDTSGTLFVVAAGNSGARATVGTPGAADRALTVGSVTKDDTLSTFSSRGPRRGDHGLKPEISAPGSDIIAARAVGTNPQISVDEHYTRMSGTSMATPHVAGAAAILAARHPEWTGAQIKDALVSSAKRLPDIDTYAQGAGRLDIARAVTQPVRAEGVLGFGTAWAGEGDSVEREVSYANDGDTPVTLDLELAVDSDVFSVEDTTVTVPPHGTASVSVTARVPADPEGEPSGALIATADGVALTTPITGELPGEPHTLTVKVLSRDETPDTSLLVVQDERTGKAQSAIVEGDTATFTVPAGSYRVLGRAMDHAAGTDTFFVERTGEVDEDTELVVDTGRGAEITSSVDDPDARAQPAGGTAIMSRAGGTGASIARTGNVSRHAKLYAVGSPRMSGVSLVHFGYWTHPFATVTVDGPDGFEVEDSYVSSYPRLAGTVTGEVADVGYADRAAIDAAGDVRGKVAVIATDPDNPAYPPGRQLRDGIALLAERGAKVVLSNFNPQYDQSEYEDLALPVVMVFNNRDLREVVARLANGPVTTTVVGRANSPVAYFVAGEVAGRIPGGHAFRFTRARMGAVDRELVDTLPDKQYRYTIANWSLGGLTAGADVELDWPHRRTDYVSAGSPLSLFGQAGFTEDGDGFGNETAAPMSVRPGERKHVRMFGAPFGPELTTAPTSRQDGKPVPYAYRQGDRLALSVPMFADNDPADASSFDTTNKGSTVVLRDGREIGRRGDLGGLGTFDVPAGRGTYTVVAEANRAASLLQEPALSTRTRAEWTFHAGPGTRERVALPFLDVRWRLPLDDHNRAAAGPLRGGVTVATQPGARASGIRSVVVEVSYDEGRTWRTAAVDRDGGGGFAVRIPAGGAAGGYASLRATAADGAGNAVTETVTRAYALR